MDKSKVIEENKTHILVLLFHLYICTVKFAAVIFCLVSIFLQTSSNLLVLAEYHLNKKYIARQLCENRNKPQMHCNGKCYLKKRLAALEQESNSKSAIAGKLVGSIVLFCIDPVMTGIGFPASRQLFLDAYRFYIHSSPHFNVFHPPMG